MAQYLIDPNNPPSPELAAKLTAAGIPMVLPTPRPTADGMVAEEQPAQVVNGELRQVWALVPAPVPEPDPVVIPDLTDIQFAQVLVIAGILTAAEAEGWVAAGQIPALALAAIASLPAEQQPFARIRFAGARTITRDDPFLALLQQTMAAKGAPISDAQLDDMFLQGSAL